MSTDAVKEHIQEASTDALLDLFDVDATGLGGNVYRFATATLDGNPVTWRGEDYPVVPIQATGFEMNGTGKAARPTLAVSNVAKAASAAVIAYGNLEGAPVTRWRVFSGFLDGQPNADTNAFLTKDDFIIDRKSKHNSQVIEWELSPAMDQVGVMLPRRQILRDTCPWRYRVYDEDTQDFDYTKANCPYAGSSYFDALGNSVQSKAEDKCSKRFSSGCLKRYPTGALPFGGFPGVGVLR